MDDLEKVKEEFDNIDLANNVQKDILIVVHNQFDYVKNCLKSIFENTKSFNLHIWDNASNKKTKDYLNKIYQKKENVFLYRSEENLGFIVPNNRMAQGCNSEYIILLNSDTQVLNHWDKVLIGFLKKNKDVYLVGYEGGILNAKGKGVDVCSGYSADYICGYCMCFSKKTYEEFGLFDDKNLRFAYCEDSDFSLRIKDKNKKIYACYAKDLVFHFGGKTSNSVINEKMAKVIEANMEHMQKKWANYLKEKEC